MSVSNVNNSFIFALGVDKEVLSFHLALLLPEPSFQRHSDYEKEAVLVATAATRRRLFRPKDEDGDGDGDGV